MDAMPVDLYLRKSNRDERRSVSRQLADMTAAAEAHGLTIARVFVDPDLSASRFATKARPDFTALVAHIQAGGCRVLGLAESSRGSRTLAEWAQLLDLCRSKGVLVWIQTHDRVYNLARRRDWRTLADDGVDAADESEKISERTRSGQRQAAVKGRPVGGPHYGLVRQYDERGKLAAVVPHPERAPVVAELVERVAAGERLYALARELNVRGIKPLRAAAWNETLVRSLVRSPANVGLRVHQGEVVGPAMWPALVELETWERACAVLVDPARRTSTRGTELRYWLSGAIGCGRCGAQLRHQVRTDGRRIYQCRECRGIVGPALALETVIQAALLARLERKDARALFRSPSGPTPALRRAETALRALQDQADANERAYAAGTITARLAGLREADLAPKIAQARAEVDRLTLPADLADLAGVDIPTAWDGFTPHIKRAVTMRLARLVLAPAIVSLPYFDIRRLDGSRWANDKRTWGELVRHPSQ